MENLKVGQVVRHFTKGFFLLMPDNEPGKFQLVPINLDHGRLSVELTPEITKDLQPIC